MRLWSLVLSICIAVLALTFDAPADEFRAYYTKVDSGEEFEQYSRTGPFADIVVELEDGKFVFWRGTSYLPYWETSQGKWSVDEIIERSGDGTEKKPDRVNTFSRIALVESTPNKALIYWRYLPEFSGENPKLGVDQTEFVDEYFEISSNGKVKRTVRKGTEKIEDWRDPKNIWVQTFTLTADGIENVKTQKPSLSKKEKAVKGSPVRKTDVGNPVAWWNFDEAKGEMATEEVDGTKSEIVGHKSLWKPGVSGTALQFDGYNTLISLPASEAPEIANELTLEGWVAIGAYPWSWTPIVKQTDEEPEQLLDHAGQRAWLHGEEGREEYEEQMEEDSADFDFVLKPEDDRGYYLGINAYGHPGFKLRVGDKWEELVADMVLDRYRWYHVAGTYDGDTGKMKLFVDGDLVAEESVAKGDIELSSKEVKIGKGKPRRPTRPVRANTFQDSYSFDGLIDEVKIHNTALSEEEVAKVYDALMPDKSMAEKAPLEVRSLPSGKNIDKFAGYYTHMDFYETWDNLWRFSDHPDVVVEFDENPSKFVFWRGVCYIPMLMNEKGHWYSNEFNETWNKTGGQGCMEPMSDKESYTNHARIIENTPARVVVHWRYPLIDVLHVFANYDPDTGWSDWSDWYYYIYPDGVAVKTMHLWTHGERNHEWHEGMAILGPNQHPEDVLETEPALILADLEGNVSPYEWVDGPPTGVNYDNKKIHIVNYQAEYSPFTIGDFEGGDVYSGEVTEYAVFPSWNHWPVSQMPSDGRYATYPDRTAHSSLTHVELPTYRENFGKRPFQEKVLMEGMSNKSAKELIPLAKSWLQPAELEVESGGSTHGYEKGERAYVLHADGDSMTVTINGSEDSPVINPCFVIHGWEGDKVSLSVNGETIKKGKDFRYGRRNTVDDNAMIVWFEIESMEPVEVTLSTK